MAKENSDTNKPTGDVDNIRKILFGDQIAQIEERFHQNENAISQLRTENRNLRQALEAEVTMRENAVQELRDLLESFKTDQTDTWKNDLSAQEQLVSALEKALGKFKTDINALSR